MEASCTLSFSTGEDIPLFPGHFYDIVPPSASARKAHQDYVRVRNSDEPAPTKVLAQLEVQGPIVAISAQNSDVFISPSPFPVKSQSHFRLRSAGQPEQRIKYLILREGETIRFTNQKFSFKLIYNITESRVNSSAPAEKVQVNSSVPNEGYDNTLEDSSARQVTVEKLPDTRLQQRSTVKDSVATPRASARSQLVEETPTASRIQQTVPMGSMSEKSVYISAYDGTADEPSPSHRRPSLFGGDSGADDRVSTDHEDLDIEFGKVVMPLQEASTAGRGQHATKEDEDEGSEEDEDEDTLTVGGSKSLKGLPKAAEEEAESEGEDEGGAEEKIGEEDEPDDGGKVEEDKETAAAKEDAMNTAIDDSADHDGGRSTSLKPSPPETAPKKRRRTEAERLQEADLPTKRPKTSKIVSETEDVRDNFGSLDDDEIVVAPRKPGRPPKKGRAPVYKGKRGPKKLVAAEIEDENLEESSEEAAEKAPQRRVKKAVAAEIEDEDPEESSEEAAEKAPQRKVKKVVKSEIRVDVPPRASTSPDKTPIASFSESQTSKGTPSSAKAAYDGDTLEVVLTNSKLTNMKQMMKFLEDHCNRKEAVSEDTDVVW